LSALDADFLRHAFSQPFGPSLNLSAYLSAATISNGAGPVSPLFSSNFSPSNFLQSLTNTTPLALPPSLSHTHTNGYYHNQVFLNFIQLNSLILSRNK
jgi:hypothetical protein